MIIQHHNLLKNTKWNCTKSCPFFPDLTILSFIIGSQLLYKISFPFFSIILVPYAPHFCITIMNTWYEPSLCTLVMLHCCASSSCTLLCTLVMHPCFTTPLWIHNMYSCNAILSYTSSIYPLMHLHSVSQYASFVITFVMHLNYEPFSNTDCTPLLCTQLMNLCNSHLLCIIFLQIYYATLLCNPIMIFHYAKTVMHHVMNPYYAPLLCKLVIGWHFEFWLSYPAT